LKISIGQKSEECIVHNLEDIGREQFFWHYPYSELPIRDITEKTEPHIEIGAENYLRCCIQRNIRGFCHSKEKYLFLCTTCRNRVVGGGEFFGRRFIVGYIEKKKFIKIGDRLAVIGNTYLVPFDSKLSYDGLGLKRGIFMQKFDKKEDIKKLLRLIHSHSNIRVHAIKEMIEKEENARTKGKSIPIDCECLGQSCEFIDICLRRKLQ
jgi:hypothetical protein